MLATIGFIITGGLFILLAYTFNEAVNKSKLNLKPFSYAYYCLGLAVLLWAFAATNGSSSVLAHSVIVGDTLILLGTLFMVDILIHNKGKDWLILLSVLIACVFLYERVVNYYPEPFMLNGVLFFNVQHPVVIALSLIFIGVWIPAGMKAIRSATNTLKVPQYYPLYFWFYVVTGMTTLVFLQAHRRPVVIISFIGLAASALGIVTTNLIIKTLKEAKRGAK